LSAINQVLVLVSEKDQNIQVNMQHLTKLKLDADVIFNDETALEIATYKRKAKGHMPMQKICLITWL
jgi:hypothetical protein